MKKTTGTTLRLAAAATLLLGALAAQARDTTLRLSIADALNTPEAQSKLDGSVKFYFGDQKTPKVLQTLGSDVSNRKTNAFNKSDEEG